MIKNFIITGDTHGRVPARLDRIKAERPDLIPEETAIVILGDAGINYWLNKPKAEQLWQLSTTI